MLVYCTYEYVNYSIFFLHVHFNGYIQTDKTRSETACKTVRTKTLSNKNGFRVKNFL